VKTTARRDGNGYLVNGSKTFITNGQLANFILVVAKTDPSQGAKGVSLVVVETDGAEGFRRGRNLHKVGMEGNDTSELFFDDVRIPTENLLGVDEGRGFYQLMDQLPQERLNIAIQGIAVIEAALEQTIAYVRSGRPSARRSSSSRTPSSSWPSARPRRPSRGSSSTTASRGWSRGPWTPPQRRWPSTGSPTLQCKIVDECLQLHGGYGYMNEYPIARMYKDSRVQRIYGGTNEIMKMLIARTL
jgi:acyl-CoA dehydrogenase